MPKPKPGPIMEIIERHSERIATLIAAMRVPTREELAAETMATARMAQLVGDLPTAIKGFEAVGKMIGITDTHLHLHSTPGALLEASDEDIAAMLAAARAKPAEVLSTTTESGTSPWTTGTLFSEVDARAHADALLA